MPAVDVPILSDSSKTEVRKYLVLTGDSSIAQRLLDSEKISSPQQLSSGDGFVIKSVETRDFYYLVLWGKSDIGTLYAVVTILHPVVGWLLQGLGAGGPAGGVNGLGC